MQQAELSLLAQEAGVPMYMMVPVLADPAKTIVVRPAAGPLIRMGVSAVMRRLRRPSLVAAQRPSAPRRTSTTLRPCAAISIRACASKARPIDDGCRRRSQTHRLGLRAVQGFLPQQRVREGAQPGRNDPCPCGSGKKYKKCCGAAA